MQNGKTENRLAHEHSLWTNRWSTHWLSAQCIISSFLFFFFFRIFIRNSSRCRRRKFHKNQLIFFFFRSVSLKLQNTVNTHLYPKMREKNENHYVLYIFFFFCSNISGARVKEKNWSANEIYGCTRAVKRKKNRVKSKSENWEWNVFCVRLDFMLRDN